MAKGKQSAVEKPVRGVDDEDQATLAAIDEGISDADAGRTIPIKKVRERAAKWVPASSSAKERRTIWQRSLAGLLKTIQKLHRVSGTAYWTTVNCWAVSPEWAIRS